MPLQAVLRRGLASRAMQPARKPEHLAKLLLREHAPVGRLLSEREGALNLGVAGGALAARFTPSVRHRIYASRRSLGGRRSGEVDARWARRARRRGDGTIRGV